MIRHALPPWLLIALATACTPAHGQNDKPPRALPRSGEEVATFAGGCFWCMEPPFEGLPGVRSVMSGYTGGPEKDPGYKAVSGGRTGHTEAVQIVFDPDEISYEKLLDVFFRSMDPTDKDGQFADRGRQYRPGIFYHHQRQKKLAWQARKALEASGRFDKPIVVEITRYQAFYPAETYHQDYYKKNPAHYKSYRKGSGREAFLQRVWGSSDPGKQSRKSQRYRKPSERELRERLSALQYRVTQRGGTERPFDNAYWDHKREGIYVDVVSGEPLFSSRDKFASGTGWPSFTRPLVDDNVVSVLDRSHGTVRTEVRSKYGDSHLGHVFEDGPPPTGLRYCINSAALRFVPRDELQAQGYGELEKHFAATQARR